MGVKIQKLILLPLFELNLIFREEILLSCLLLTYENTTPTIIFNVADAH